jgi:hypothetical protein
MAALAALYAAHSDADVLLSGTRAAAAADAASTAAWWAMPVEVAEKDAEEFSTGNVADKWECDDCEEEDEHLEIVPDCTLTAVRNGDVCFADRFSATACAVSDHLLLLSRSIAVGRVEALAGELGALFAFGAALCAAAEGTAATVEPAGDGAGDLTVAAAAEAAAAAEPQPMSLEDTDDEVDGKAVLGRGRERGGDARPGSGGGGRRRRRGLSQSSSEEEEEWKDEEDIDDDEDGDGMDDGTGGGGGGAGGGAGHGLARETELVSALGSVSPALLHCERRRLRTAIVRSQLLGQAAWESGMPVNDFIISCIRAPWTELCCTMLPLLARMLATEVHGPVAEPTYGYVLCV